MAYPQLISCLLLLVDITLSSSGGSRGTQQQQCRKPGFSAVSCTKFQRCVQFEDGSFVNYQFECGEGTVWNQKLETCTHGTCSGSSSSESSQVGPSGSGSGSVAGSSDPKICKYDLKVSYIVGSPDGKTKRIMGVNGQFPGPTLRCEKGAWMHVRVSNELDEPTSIHWHGIEQNLSPFYDGPEMVSQCPIPPSTSMEYIFQLDQSGTYWYHSHHSYQYVDGLWGPLIIHNPKEVWRHAYNAPQDELLFTLNDWHYTNAKTLSEKWLNRTGFPRPDTGLVNGRGLQGCMPSSINGSCDPSTPVPGQWVTANRTYRIRIINTSALSNFNFSIDGHKMDVIEVDGVDTERVGPVDVITLWPAQRYSALVYMPYQPNTRHLVRAAMNSINYTAMAYLNYDSRISVPAPASGMSISATAVGSSDSGEQGRPATHAPPTAEEIRRRQNIIQQIQSRSSHRPAPAPPTPAIQEALAIQVEPELTAPAMDTTIPRALVHLDPSLCVPKQSRGDSGPPNYYDIEFVLNQTFCDDPAKYPHRSICINDQPYTIGTRPVLLQAINGESIPGSSNPFYIDTYNTVVQLVINNAPGPGAGHPWHFHGHTFWVMGTGAPGAGPYVKERDEPTLNVTQALRRDTTHGWTNSWVVVRFIADNPGAWLFHCHINWHLQAGLGAVFVESRQHLQRLFRVPEDWLRVCRTAGVPGNVTLTSLSN